MNELKVSICAKGIDNVNPFQHNNNMPERSSNKNKVTKDINILAASIVEGATTESTGKNLAAMVLGSLGGKKGGPARAKKLTPEQRSDIARRAAQARWQKVADSQ